MPCSVAWNKYVLLDPGAIGHSVIPLTLRSGQRNYRYKLRKPGYDHETYPSMLLVFFWVIPCQCMLVLINLSTGKIEKMMLLNYPLPVIELVTVISRKSPQSERQMSQSLINT